MEALETAVKAIPVAVAARIALFLAVFITVMGMSSRAALNTENALQNQKIEAVEKTQTEQKEEFNERLDKMDRKLDRILERLPPRGR